MVQNIELDRKAMLTIELVFQIGFCQMTISFKKSACVVWPWTEVVDDLLAK